MHFFLLLKNCISVHSTLFTCTTQHCGGKLCFFSWCALKDEKKLSQKSCVQSLLPPTLHCCWPSSFPSSRSPISALLLPAVLEFFFFLWMMLLVRRPEKLLCIFLWFNFFRLKTIAVSYSAVRSVSLQQECVISLDSDIKTPRMQSFLLLACFSSLESFSWEILHRIYWIFLLFHLFFNHFSTSSPMCSCSVLVWSCRWCDTSHSRSEGRGNLLWHKSEGSMVKRQRYMLAKGRKKHYEWFN